MKSFVPAAFMAGGALAAFTVEPHYVTTFAPESTVEPSLTAIAAAAATAKPSSPTSNVKGAGFDRFLNLWLENTDFNVSAADPNMQWIASQGITLTNYFATTHPSEPNYAAVAGGDNFGMDNDDFHVFPMNISNVADMLEFGGIAWAEYQEGMPYAGFPGFNYSVQTTYANKYVRKHNPLILFDNIMSNATRSSQIKNFTTFEDDVKNKQLPQWAFITPNMTNDAHDTNISFAGNWLREWLPPLLNNSYFMNNTLFMITFDENEDYPIPNKVQAILLGGVIPEALKGTTDDTYYNHYSTISTVAVNWGLPQLGRWDCGANVLQTVANKTGYKNSAVDLTHLSFNQSYPGPVSELLFAQGFWPAPDTMAKCASGKGVLPAIKATWGNTTGSYNYTNVYPYDQLSGINAAGTPVIGINDRTSTSGPGSNSSSNSTTPTHTNDAVSFSGPNVMTIVAVAGLVAAFL